MARKKTIEEINAQIKATEARLRQQKRELAEATEMERAKQNAEIIKAVDTWNNARHEPIPREQLAATFLLWAEKEKGKRK